MDPTGHQPSIQCLMVDIYVSLHEKNIAADSHIFVPLNETSLYWEPIFHFLWNLIKSCISNK